MSSETETEVVENPSESVTEEEKVEIIEEQTTTRNTRRRTNLEHQKQEAERDVDVKKENKERKTKKKTVRRNLIREESDEEDETTKPSPRKPRERKEKIKASHQKKINEKRESDESDDIVHMKKSAKKIKTDEPSNTKTDDQIPPLSDTSLYQQPLIKQEPLEPPQPHLAQNVIPTQLPSIPQNYIQSNPQNTFSNITIQPLENTSQPYVQLPNQQIPNSVISVNQPIPIQQSIIMSDNRDFELKRSQEHQSAGVSFKFEKTHGYLEGDGAYDPLVGLYAGRRNEQERSREPPMDYTKLKTTVSKFVVDRLQQFYDNRTIATKEEFKHIARDFTIKFTNELYRDNQPFTQKIESYYNDIICRQFAPHYY